MANKVKGKKVFISYKHADTDVQKLPNTLNTTARDYVNLLQEMFEDTPHIYKGEEDDNDLSRFKNSTIESKLRNKIYDSTVTIILISNNMWDKTIPEDDQWIPWEISYSLKEYKREGRTSLSNALLAVVLPDKNESYEYFIKDNSCPTCNCRSLSINKLFRMIKENMFNVKESKIKRSDCPNHSSDSKPYIGYSSYIHSVKWLDFIKDDVSIDKYLKIALDINERIGDYGMTYE